MKKVFYRCIGECENLTIGKEYEPVPISGLKINGIIDDSGADRLLIEPGMWRGFERIEREFFTAHGFEWFRHTPGEPMLCDPHAQILAHYRDGYTTTMRGNLAENFRWNAAGAKEDPGCDIIGRRYADSAQTSGPEPQTSGANLRTCDANPKFASIDTLRVGDIVCRKVETSKAWSDAAKKIVDALVDGTFNQDESERNDLIAAVDDGHLTPGQKAYIQAKEDAQAAKQQLKHDAEAKALQERAEQLSDAGRAMDRVNQDHNHKLGWLA